MSQSVTEKRTVVQSSSSGYGAEEPFRYKSAVQTRSSVLSGSTVKSRSSFVPSYAGGRPSSTYSYQASYGLQAPLPIVGYTKISNSNVSHVKTHREREKKDMQDLNERLANYIEKVRFLEAQNKKLVTELEDLKSKWGKETAAIKEMYETELKEVREVLDDTSKERSRLELEVRDLQEQNQNLYRQLDEAKKYRQIDRDQINKLNQQLSEYDGEISMLRRTMENMEKDRERDKNTIARLTQDVEKMRMELAAETLAHLDCENRLQTLTEEMEFMKSLHEEEMKELANLAYRDTTEENREFWKNELSSAIREIQAEYDAKCDQIRGDMEGYYNLKVQEIRTGITKQNMEAQHSKEETRKWRTQVTELKAKLADVEARNANLERTIRELQHELEEKDQDAARREASLREEITQLRLELEKILQELQTLMDAKLSLELEIAAYRKLLEGEESRIEVHRSPSGVTITREGGGAGSAGAGSSSSMSAGGGSMSAGGGSMSAGGGSMSAGGSSMSAGGGGISSGSASESHMVSSSASMSSSSAGGMSMSATSGGGGAGDKGEEGADDGNNTDPGETEAVPIKPVGSQSNEAKPRDSKRGSKNVEQPKIDSQMSMKMMRGEVSAKTTYQRTSKGAVSIAEANPEGKFILLENNSTGSTKRDENMEGWRIVRNIDGKRDVYYNFPMGFALRSGKSVRIFASKHAAQASMNDLVFKEENSWGVGSQVVTRLLNAMGEEKASHTQKTLYQ